MAFVSLLLLIAALRASSLVAPALRLFEPQEHNQAPLSALSSACWELGEALAFLSLQNVASEDTDFLRAFTWDWLLMGDPALISPHDGGIVTFLNSLAPNRPRIVFAAASSRLLQPQRWHDYDGRAFLSRGAVLHFCSSLPQACLAAGDDGEASMDRCREALNVVPGQPVPSPISLLLSASCSEWQQQPEQLSATPKTCNNVTQVIFAADFLRGE